ncbi:uncharacterized protein B0T15DRAFT_512260 [Chaetomium strumarium]|uniref:EamA domain-containing protein n=1 Tax=Chaetomium strumarium TaxID=1170767 RepID=A0AAJ0GQ38_9PEZI|nr:hypothetical protein B0T15DRAFT_512260 [Chaetomium strumarium]
MLPSLNPRQTPRKTTRLGDDSDDALDSIPLEELSSNKPSSPFLNPHVSRSLSASPFSEHGRLSPCQTRALSPAPYTHPLQTRRAAIAQCLRRFWADNRAVLLVGVSQFFGALMNLAAKLLEMESGMRPMQILFARQSMTTALSCLYMWWNMIPDFPLGPRGVRGVLLIRGISGFFGIYGMWFSMRYLPLAEATVITFLAPMLSGYMCDLLLKDPFTRREQLASFIAIAGVVLIARPTSLFGSGHSDDGGVLPADQTNSTIIPEIPTVFARVAGAGTNETEPTPAQRLLAIMVALVGVLGAAGAYTAIRCIGKRAHPLITVTYFSACSTVVSTVALLVLPHVGWPDMNFAGLLLSSAYEWFLLLSLGTCGFVMQFIMTAGLGGSDGRNANRATAMTYTHMLFAAAFDRWVFDHRMGVVSVVGCGLIVGSALWAALGKKTPAVSPGEGGGGRERSGDVERNAVGGGEEAVPMLGDGGVGDEGEEEAEGEQRRSPRNHP